MFVLFPLQLSLSRQHIYFLMSFNIILTNALLRGNVSMIIKKTDEYENVLSVFSGEQVLR